MSEPTAAAPAAVKAADVLDLNTSTATRRVIKVDGESYNLRNQNELSLAARVRIARAGARFEDIDDHDKLREITDEQIDALQADIRSAARSLIVSIPDAVFERLLDEQCLAVVQAFGLEPGSE
jgi:hypothetical protein